MLNASKWPLSQIEVRASGQPGSGKIATVETELILGGDLRDKQRQRLHEISARCPMTQTLQAGVKITHR